MARNSLKNIARLIDGVCQTLSPEQSFLNDLKRSIELTEDRHLHKLSQTYKPSSMQCIRNMYYQVMGVDVDEGNSNYCLIGICNSGTDIHERVQKYVADMINNNIDCKYINVGDYVRVRNLEDIQVISQNGMETKLYHSKYNISFLCDGIIRYGGKYYILELKTESLYKWQSRTGVDEKHYNQAITYSMALGLEDVIFVYINRDNVDMKSFMFHVTNEMRDSIVQKILKCNEYVNRRICPPKPDNLQKSICNYCNYKTLCKSEV